jgi:nucleoside 2-deoxyribosyltransferase
VGGKLAHLGVLMNMDLPTVYLSARFSRREELNRYRERLAEAGIEVTSRWLTDPTPELTDEAWRTLAAKDRGDIRRADALVLFADSKRDSRGGRHVEFGMALALEKRLIVVGEIENLFQRLTEVEVVNSWEEAVALFTQAPEQVALERE